MGQFLVSPGGRILCVLVLFSLLEALQVALRSFKLASRIVQQISAAIGAVALGAAAWADGASVDDAGATALTTFLGAMGVRGGWRAWARQLADRKEDAALAKPPSVGGEP